MKRNKINKTLENVITVTEMAVIMEVTDRTVRRKVSEGYFDGYYKKTSEGIILLDRRFLNIKKDKN